MDWKKIMNRKSQKADMTEEIGEFLEALIPELNLRLLLEMEPSTELLWVESITVTAYESVQEGSSALCRLGSRIGRIWNRLTGLRSKSPLP